MYFYRVLRLGHLLFSVFSRSFVFVIIRSNYWQCCYCEAWRQSPWRFWFCFCYNLSFFVIDCKQSLFSRKSVGKNGKHSSVRGWLWAWRASGNSAGIRRRARLPTPSLIAARGTGSSTSRSHAYLFDVLPHGFRGEERLVYFRRGENARKVPVRATPDPTLIKGVGGGGEGREITFLSALE